MLYSWCCLCCQHALPRAGAAAFHGGAPPRQPHHRRAPHATRRVPAAQIERRRASLRTPAPARRWMMLELAQKPRSKSLPPPNAGLPPIRRPRAMRRLCSCAAPHHRVTSSARASSKAHSEVSFSSWKRRRRGGGPPPASTPAAPHPARAPLRRARPPRGSRAQRRKPRRRLGGKGPKSSSQKGSQAEATREPFGKAVASSRLKSGASDARATRSSAEQEASMAPPPHHKSRFVAARLSANEESTARGHSNSRIARVDIELGGEPNTKQSSESCRLLAAAAAR